MYEIFVIFAIMVVLSKTCEWIYILLELLIFSLFLDFLHFSTVSLLNWIVHFSLWIDLFMIPIFFLSLHFITVIYGAATHAMLLWDIRSSPNIKLFMLVLNSINFHQVRCYDLFYEFRPCVIEKELSGKVDIES
jgi:predicted membrane protein